jgi:hypothetical protein
MFEWLEGLLGELLGWLEGLAADGLEWLHRHLLEDAQVQLGDVLASLVTALLLGCVVAGVYRLTHRGEQAPAPGFIPTLVLLAVLISVVTRVIGDNTARAFSLVGALSIVRFRTVVEDTRDTAFVIFAVVVGMAAGAGALKMALACALVGGLTAFLVRPRHHTPPPVEDDWVLSLRLGIGQEQQEAADAVLKKGLESCQTVSAATARQGATLELTYRVRLRAGVQPAALVAELNRVEGVQGVELRRR